MVTGITPGIGRGDWDVVTIINTGKLVWTKIQLLAWDTLFTETAPVLPLHLGAILAQNHAGRGDRHRL
jgi:hypothetical protein